MAEPGRRGAVHYRSDCRSPGPDSCSGSGLSRDRWGGCDPKSDPLTDRADQIIDSTTAGTSEPFLYDATGNLSIGWTYAAGAYGQSD